MTELAWTVAVTAVVLIAMETLFRMALWVRGSDFVPPKRVRDLYVIPHPYLPYVFRANARVKNDEPARYPLHRGRFEFRTVRTNSLGLLGPELADSKPDGVTRVLCLGASVTENSIWEVGEPTEHTYPIHLQGVLDDRAGPGWFEVVNCGVGGWTTAEILVNFALRLVDLRPDIVVLYHGLGDLTPSLTAPFRPDYSHSRRNFGEAYARIKLASRLPSLRWWKSYSYATARLMGFGNVRYDVLSSIRVAAPEISAPFRGLATERRNVEHLLELCRLRGVRVILSTFAYHVYDAVAEDPATLRYRDGVLEENEMMRGLAAARGLRLIDVAREMPRQDAYFVDSVHFTPLGMRWVAERFGEAILAATTPAASAASLALTSELPSS